MWCTVRCSKVGPLEFLILYFFPLQWNYLRWLRQRRHFTWWWSTPAAVSEQDLTHTRFHVRVWVHSCSRRISPSDCFTGFGCKHEVWVDGASATAALVWSCASLRYCSHASSRSRGSPRISAQGLDQKWILVQINLEMGFKKHLLWMKLPWNRDCFACVKHDEKWIYRYDWTTTLEV